MKIIFDILLYFGGFFKMADEAGKNVNYTFSCIMYKLDSTSHLIQEKYLNVDFKDFETFKT